MITVFTPTYNRAYILPKLYASLRTQTSDNFEWVIVDDGSTDETKRLVTGWLSDNNKFCVRYYNRENGGKHRAINFGVQVARGELFFIVDSDDYLTPDAVETLILWEASIKNDDKFCGVAGEKASIRDGSIIGNPVSSGEYIDATALEREYYFPLATAIPAFLAEDTPPFSLWITRTRLSFSAYSSHIAGQPSGLPSSTRINSKFVNVWARILSIHWRRYGSTL